MRAHGILLQRRQTTQHTFDDSGIEIKGGIVPMRSEGEAATYMKGFPHRDECTPTYVPPLYDLCLDLVKRKPALFDSITEVLAADQAVRCIRMLIRDAQDLKYVRPLTWLAWVKAYGHDLGEELLSYPLLALSDAHILDISRAPESTSFCLLVDLNLAACRNLDDANIRQLGALDNLCVLNTSQTTITHAGVQALSQALVVDQDGTLRGPWRLRVWKLDHTRVTPMALEFLQKWPLLCALDLTADTMRKMTPPSGWHTPSPDELALFQPRADRYLSAVQPPLFPSHPTVVSVQEHYPQTVPRIIDLTPWYNMLRPMIEEQARYRASREVAPRFNNMLPGDPYFDIHSDEDEWDEEGGWWDPEWERERDSEGYGSEEYDSNPEYENWDVADGELGVEDGNSITEDYSTGSNHSNSEVDPAADPHPNNSQAGTGMAGEQLQAATTEAEIQHRETAAREFYRPLNPSVPRVAATGNDASLRATQLANSLLFCRTPPPCSVLTGVVEAAKKSRTAAALTVENHKNADQAVARKRQKTVHTPSLASLYTNQSRPSTTTGVNN
ncbi:hypothetical protein DACRYDRAFT_115112 [Dacryopinax primogenitus]|uniref:RNI-like protein n=1 Tax=Dacryopinax primogenitus (strain DJM 731) TaxID=1858805 RepID=M5G551_DACPD|nr:uncharacterized protein DACRYDRAFT_115112 [Dacryopinax primogenitus]EJU03794.1 hypothetical protein DACRYDRAFT_115112 [Dacryopinax primogenitus]